MNNNQLISQLINSPTPTIVDTVLTKLNLLDNLLEDYNGLRFRVVKDNTIFLTDSFTKALQAGGETITAYKNGL